MKVLIWASYISMVSVLTPLCIVISTHLYEVEKLFILNKILPCMFGNGVDFLWFVEG